MSGMSDIRHVVLIHGTWGNGDTLGDATIGLRFGTGVLRAGLALPGPGRGRQGRFLAIRTPVLAIGGKRDRLVNFRVARATAARYPNGTYVEIPGSDHMVLHGTALPVTMARIDEWMARHQVFTAESSPRS